MYYLEMSTPVLIHPKTGEVVINVKNGPAPGLYKDAELDGLGGALMQFKRALGTRKNNAIKKLGKTLGNYIERDDKIRALQQEYAISQTAQHRLRKGHENHATAKKQSATIAKKLANLGAPPKLKHSNIATLFGYNNRSKGTRKFNANMNAAKRACGWKPQGIFRKLGPSKHSSGDCATEEAILDKIREEQML